MVSDSHYKRYFVCTTNSELFRFNGCPIYAELCPVTDFRESRCRQHEVVTCNKGGFCNFMHLKAISPQLGEKLYGRKGRRFVFFCICMFF